MMPRYLLTSLDSILKSRDIILPTKICLVKAIVFPVVMYGCESWTIKKAEHRRIDAFELWCWRRLLSVPWTARRTTQSILKEISPEYSLEGLMLKLKLNTLATWCEELIYWKRPWCWERLKVGGEGDDRGWDGWMASLTQRTWVWVSSRSWWWTGKPGVLQPMGSESDITEQLNWTVKSDQECSPLQLKQVYKIVHTWWVVNGNDFLSPTYALQICLWAPLSCFYNSILGRCLGLPAPFGYQYNIIFSYSSAAPISKGHFHISKLTTPFLYSSNCDMFGFTMSHNFSLKASPSLWALFLGSWEAAGHLTLVSFPGASSKTPCHSTLLMLQDQERVEERDERLRSPGNGAPAIGKWASCPDKHFSPTGIRNPLPHSTSFSSTAQFPNSTVDSLANIFLTFTTQLQPQE